MIRSVLSLAAAAGLSLISTAPAFSQSASPVCQRLEGQLSSLDRGNEDPARADATRRAEDAAARQQFELDRLVAQSRRLSCEGSGFFSIFSSPPPQCGPLRRQIDQARASLDRTQNDLERLHGGTTERMGQRRAILIALSDNGCGPQYRQAALQQGGFLEQLFGGREGGRSFNPADQSGTFRTLCVRTCDGYYFPISYAAPASRFQDDARTCQRMCPAAEVSLYTYHNPGEDVAQAVSLSGQPYSALPSAFRYRTELNAACSCRRAGQSWSEALKTGGTDETIEQGDIVVTEDRAKKMSQPTRDASGRPIKQGQAPVAAQAATTETAAEPPKGKVRTVGPTFYPVR
jgi:hypothetical protein